MIEQRNPLGYYIGHVNDIQHRIKASSGGIGTMLQKHLLSSGKYGTSITFCFNAEKCMYEAKLIHSAEEVNICGSIYQDIDITQFVSEHTKEITNGIVVSCPPCQVSAIRNMLNRENIPCFIISFCCSGQTTIDGTWRYYKLLGIKKKNIVHMQYRGNGWPSGIQIWMKDGSRKFCMNYTDPWKTLHASKLYRPKRCFFCTFDTSRIADISLADPWLDKYIQHDNKGNTLFLVNTTEGLAAIQQMQASDLLSYEETNYAMYCAAQQNNLSKSDRVRYHKKRLQRTQKLTSNPFIHYLFSRNLFMMRLFQKLQNRL